jgi:hypothetical protein
VYYISEVLHEAKTRYLEVHKLLYVVVITSRKPRHYFQADRISATLTRLAISLNGSRSWLSFCWISYRAM